MAGTCARHNGLNSRVIDPMALSRIRASSSSSSSYEKSNRIFSKVNE